MASRRRVRKRTERNSSFRSVPFHSVPGFSNHPYCVVWIKIFRGGDPATIQYQASINYRNLGNFCVKKFAY